MKRDGECARVERSGIIKAQFGLALAAHLWSHAFNACSEFYYAMSVRKVLELWYQILRYLPCE